jgi:hypothetical protein
MLRLSRKNTGLIKKRAGLAPEIASIPHAFGADSSRNRPPNCHLASFTSGYGRAPEHFKKVLQSRQRLSGPVLELKVFRYGTPSYRAASLFLSRNPPPYEVLVYVIIKGELRG